MADHWPTTIIEKNFPIKYAATAKILTSVPIWAQDDDVINEIINKFIDKFT